MIDFIKKLEQKFDIQLFHEEDSHFTENSYFLDEDGNIKRLYLYEVKLEKFEYLLPIADQLQELSLYACSLKSLDALSFFPNLRKLKLGDNPLVKSSFENLKFAIHLKELILSFTNLKETSFLEDLVNLEYLDVSYNNFNKLNGHENLKLLHTLKYEYSNLKSIDHISVNENIQCLSLNSGKLTQINALEKYPNLLDLNLGSNPITKIEGLSHLKNLKKLILSATNIRKIEGLDELRKLETLDLSMTELTKIEGLSNLLNLKTLSFLDNKISEVENMDKLTKLEYVLFDSNNIKEFDTNFFKYIHSPCYISMLGNPMKEISEKIPDHIRIDFEGFGFDGLGVRGLRFL